MDKQSSDRSYNSNGLNPTFHQDNLNDLEAGKHHINLSEASTDNLNEKERNRYAEYELFRRFQAVFNTNNGDLDRAIYNRNAQHINKGLSDLTLPRISVESFPLMANPAPIGLCGFALTTFVLSTYNLVWPTQPHG